jgi:hypothetical protein
MKENGPFSETRAYKKRETCFKVKFSYKSLISICWETHMAKVQGSNLVSLSRQKSWVLHKEIKLEFNTPNFYKIWHK